MKWSYKIGMIYGIPLRMHVTFLMLIIGYAALFGYQYGSMGALRGVVLILLLFVCVVIHELAHSRQAQKFNVEVRDVTLLPIGGVSNMEQMPEEPKEELKIALAGPLASIALGGGLMIIDIVLGFNVLDFSFEKIATSFSYFPVYFAWINLLLAGFNLLPAFPMDGGRVIRAYLAQRMSYTQATNIAASIGKGFAIVFGIAGILFNPILIIIAFFVYIGANSEEYSVMIRSVLKNLTVRDVMDTTCTVVSGATQISELVERIFHGTCKGIIPVEEESEYVGIITSEELISAIHEHPMETTVGDVVEREVPTVTPEERLDEVYIKMQKGQHNAYGVVVEGELVGVITLEDMRRAYSIKEAVRSKER